MKYRGDYVTNSSSASFVMAFNDKEDLRNFKIKCRKKEYRNFYRMLVNMMGDYLEIESYSDKPINMREIIDKIPLDVMPSYAVSHLEYLKGKMLEPWSSVHILLYNPFVHDELSEDLYTILNFFKSDDWTCHVLNRKEKRKTNSAYSIAKTMLVEDDVDALVENYVRRYDAADVADYFNRLDKFRKSEFFKEKEKEILKKNGYDELKKKIDESCLVITGMVWTYEGKLEDDIGNGFIRRHFKDEYVALWCVG